MNAALVLSAWRQIPRSPARLALLALLVGLPLIDQALSASGGFVRGLGPPAFAVLACGTCSADAASGYLRVVLSRPVTRFSYLLSRWVACAVAGVAVAWGALLASALVGGFVGGEAPHPAAMARAMLDQALAGSMLAAYFVAASSVLPGCLDLVAVLALVAIQDAGRSFLPGQAAAIGFVTDVPLSFVKGGGAGWEHPAGALLLAASNVAVVLGAGAVLFNRRQVPAGARS